jgi:RNA polymerase sigma-54 factor
MKQVLQLKFGQHLTMTPQLQQAIKLLQLSSLDLRAEIQETLESNPLLEVAEDQQSADSGDASSAETSRENDKENHSSETGTDELLNQNQIDNDLPVDSTWDNYTSSASTSSSKSYDGEDTVYQGATTESLQDYLTWQLQLTPFSDFDRFIAEVIIDSIDERGYLSLSFEESLQIVEKEIGEIDEEDFGIEEFDAVVHRVQQFDPPGVAARDLRECLSIQLGQIKDDCEQLQHAKLLVDQCFDMIGTKHHPNILKQLKLTEPQLAGAIDLIRLLNPYPGESIETAEPQYVVPDVLVFKHNGQWHAKLNPESSPKIQINSGYAGLIKRADSSADNQYLKNNLQEAKWFIKSLQSRNETLLKVTQAIIEKQENFLEHGDEAMKPMVLQDIADIVEMHESTISRVTTQKYMHTPRGIFELKYFFSSHVGTAGGGECSSTAIRALLKKIISAENAKKPLSDNKIAQLLKEQGINVARRTIAKYREAMGIPPSNERKSLI